MTFRVEFAIDVSAASEVEACWTAWDTLTRPGALLPVGDVTHPDSGDIRTVDLEDEVPLSDPLRERFFIT